MLFRSSYFPPYLVLADVCVSVQKILLYFKMYVCYENSCPVQRISKATNNKSHIYEL